MMTVKDDRRGLVRLLLPPVASEKPSDVNDTERARQADGQLQRRIRDWPAYKPMRAATAVGEGVDDQM